MNRDQLPSPIFESYDENTEKSVFYDNLDALLAAAVEGGKGDFMVRFGAKIFPVAADDSAETVQAWLKDQACRWMRENHFPAALKACRPDLAAVLLAARPPRQPREDWFRDAAAAMAKDPALDYRDGENTDWNTADEKRGAAKAALSQAEYDAHMARRPKHLSREAWEGMLVSPQPGAYQLENIDQKFDPAKKRNGPLTAWRALTGMTQAEVGNFVSSQATDEGRRGAVGTLEAPNGDKNPSASTEAVYVLLALMTDDQRRAAKATLSAIRGARRNLAQFA